MLTAIKSERTLNLSRKSWYLKLIDRSGRPRYDVSPLWANHEAFAALVDDIEEHFKGIQYDLVVPMDALGFILGAAIASSSGKGLVPIRKGGKLPLPKERLMSVDFQDYDQIRKKFEVVKDLIRPGNYIDNVWLDTAISTRPESLTSCLLLLGSRVLLVDEWMGTGAQMKAAIEMMGRMEAIIAGIAVLYVFPDEPANLEIIRNYETFTANCLKCKHIDCRCPE